MVVKQEKARDKIQFIISITPKVQHPRDQFLKFIHVELINNLTSGSNHSYRIYSKIYNIQLLVYSLCNSFALHYPKRTRQKFKTTKAPTGLEN